MVKSQNFELNNGLQKPRNFPRALSCSLEHLPPPSILFFRICPRRLRGGRGVRVRAAAAALVFGSRRNLVQFSSRNSAKKVGERRE